MKKALIAMSGGVDSSAAAYLMQQRGWDCIGVTMRLFRNEDAGISRSRSRIVFDAPQRAITGGQTAVVYDGEIVVGGGRTV